MYLWWCGVELLDQVFGAEYVYAQFCDLGNVFFQEGDGWDGGSDW